MNGTKDESGWLAGSDGWLDGAIAMADTTDTIGACTLSFIL